MIKKVSGGQVGLLLLVVMGIVVALVMSVASLSLSDTVISRQERESSAAFSVAETGVEKALNALGGGGGEFSGSLTGLVNPDSGVPFVTGNYKVEPSTTFGLYVREGETAHLDLSTYVPTLTIAWTKKSDSSENLTGCSEGSGLAPSAVEITALSATTANRVYYNPASCNPGANGFSASSDGGSIYRSQIAAYPVPVGTLMLRIKPIYAGATISVSGAGLTDQLYLIQSKASGGDAQKEIEVKRGLDAPPSIFDYAIFTAETIIK